MQTLRNGRGSEANDSEVFHLAMQNDIPVRPSSPNRNKDATQCNVRPWFIRDIMTSREVNILRL